LTKTINLINLILLKIKMKEKISWQDQEYEMEWFPEERIPDVEKSKIKQVYGFLFDSNKKLCLVRPTEKRGWRLPGGGPEPEDNDWKGTLIRETDEEADIESYKDSLKIIGYIKIIPLNENCEKGVHYALRVVGNISKINGQTEDIAEGLINERVFIEPKNFLGYCNWGEIGKIQIKKVLSIIQ